VSDAVVSDAVATDALHAMSINACVSLPSEVYSPDLAAVGPDDTPACVLENGTIYIASIDVNKTVKIGIIHIEILVCYCSLYSV